MNAFYPPQPDIGYPINPQFRQQGAPMMQPVIGNQNIPPNMMPSNMVPPPNITPPNMPIPGQFNQQGGNRMFPKQTPPPPRNNWYLSICKLISFLNNSLELFIMYYILHNDDFT